MPIPLQKQDVSERLRNYSYGNYLQISSINKGVALAAATVVGLGIISDHAMWLRLAPWFASLVAITVSYMTYGRGVILANARANVFDSIFPLLTGLTEFALFAVLSPLPAGSTTWDPWRWWFLVMSFNGLFAALLVENRIKNTLVDEDFHPELRDLGIQYVGWLRKDAKDAGVAAATSFIIWSTMFTMVRSDYAVRIQAVAAGVMGLALLFPAFRADKQRRQIDKIISQLQKSGQQS